MCRPSAPDRTPPPTSYYELVLCYRTLVFVSQPISKESGIISQYCNKLIKSHFRMKYWCKYVFFKSYKIVSTSVVSIFWYFNHNCCRLDHNTHLCQLPFLPGGAQAWSWSRWQCVHCDAALISYQRRRLGNGLRLTSVATPFLSDTP